MQLQNHFILISLGLIAAAAPISAQTVTLIRPGRYSIAFEAARPYFKDGEGLKLGTGAYFLSGHADLGSRAKLILELPYAVARGDDVPGTSNIIGNPYAGLQLVLGRSRIDLGARIRSWDSNLIETDEGQTFNGWATIIGVTTELERSEAFFRNVASLTAAIRVDAGPPTGAGVTFFGGPSLLMFTGDDEFGDNRKELLLTYGLEPVYRTASLRAGARFLGRYYATVDGDFGERSLHEVGLFADFAAARLRPGLHLRFPIDEDYFRQNHRFILGLHIQVVLSPER